MTWQNIATAPRDEPIVGGIFDGEWRFVVVKWDLDRKGWWDEQRDMCWAPTIWATYPDEDLPRK